ncbi:hypothetical protein ANCDUO_16780, partial [Ancylostoma duodenale]
VKWIHREQNRLADGASREIDYDDWGRTAIAVQKRFMRVVSILKWNRCLQLNRCLERTSLMSAGFESTHEPPARSRKADLYHSTQYEGISVRFSTAQKVQ